MPGRIAGYGFKTINTKFLPKVLEARWEEYVVVNDAVEINDMHGYSAKISNDGNYLIIGAPGGWDYGDVVYGDPTKIIGSAYVYRWDGSDWVEYGSISHEDTYSYGTGYFGESVDIIESGTRIFVSEPESYDENFSFISGSVYEYSYNGSSWIFENVIYPNIYDPNMRFGESISSNLSGTTLVIGAPDTDYNLGSGIKLSTGLSFIAKKVSGSWSTTRLVQSEGLNHSRFGTSVSIDGIGNVVVVGAPSRGSQFWVNGNVPGKAFVYEYDGSTWNETAVLSPLDGAAYDMFGVSVSISKDGQYIAVGARKHNFSGLDPAIPGNSLGSVYIYKKVSNNWTFMAKITPSLPGNFSYFGNSVSLNTDGSTLVVGSYLKDDSSANGILFEDKPIMIYDRVGETWTNRISLKSFRPNLVRDFGSIVSSNGSGDRFVAAGTSQYGDTLGLVHIFHAPQ